MFRYKQSQVGSGCGNPIEATVIIAAPAIIIPNPNRCSQFPINTRNPDMLNPAPPMNSHGVHTFQFIFDHHWWAK